MANLIDASLYDVVRSLSLYGTFCDSDVYSFVFSLSAISNQLPDNVKEMMANGPSGGMPCDVDRNSPAYIKLFYLQKVPYKERLRTTSYRDASMRLAT